jgi:ribosomal protein S8
MDNDNISEALTYRSNSPDVSTLRYAYDQTVMELESYFDLCRTSYDERRNFWNGKSRDHRKHGADAFPWEGASDVESHVIDERIARLVSLFMNALNRSNVKAFPVNVADIPRSKMVTNFLKWMVSSGYIPRFKKEMELGANYLLERGLLITYVGWLREDRTFLQKLDLNQMAQISPEMVEAITAGANDDEIISIMIQVMPGVNERRAAKALADLREFGEAEVPMVRRQVNCPDVKTLAPDGDFFFPSYVTDPQRAPYCFWKTYYTTQELQNKIVTEDWDEDFVNYVCEKYRGVNIDSIEMEQEGRRSSRLTDNAYEANELVELVHGYQRLVDPEDGSEGIYETIFHKEFDGNEYAPGYAKFELLNGYEDYPVVVTKLSEDSKRLYDTMTIPDLLRGLQNQVKVERDSRIDRNSIATNPPLLHPIGQAPSDWGPGRRIPYRRKDDYVFADFPRYNEGSVEMEGTMLQQADRLVGLDEDPNSIIRKQFLVDKYLQHSAEVLKQCFRCFQRFGPDSIYFRVTGAPDAVTFPKGNPNEEYDIIISYDVLNTDKEMQETKLQQIVNLTQLDSNGRINMTALLDTMAMAVDPMLADSILQPIEDAQEQIQKDVTDDLAKIFAGIEMPARPTGAQMAMQMIQAYLQQPDIQQRLQTDQAFAQRIQKYMGQYQFQMQQQQNAQIGRIGTAPAQMGQVNTQNINQE